jgi:hypothetical protein
MKARAKRAATARLTRLVIAGLDPAIHGEPQFSMDHRVKPGGDETKSTTRKLHLL